jgi:hypothetical protein
MIRICPGNLSQLEVQKVSNADSFNFLRKVEAENFEIDSVLIAVANESNRYTYRAPNLIFQYQRL